MIAKFWIHLPFDLFITDEEQLMLVLEEPEGPYPGIRINIPVGWGYSDLPDPTGSVHEVMAGWISRIQLPAFSETMMADDKLVARVNVLVLEMTTNEFDRSAAHFAAQESPLVKLAFDKANDYLARLRVYSRLPQIKPLVSGDRWHFQFLTDSGERMPEEVGKHRGGMAGQIKVGEPAIKTEAVKAMAARWDGPEPYVWDQLLLDADSLWPEVGSSIVMAFSALETFIAWALDRFQLRNHVFSEDFWKWITKRNDYSKEPSVAEEFDNLLEALTGRSLKSEQELWQYFTELKQARNSLVHTGTALIGKTRVDPDKAKLLIRGADKIVRWVEQLLPEDCRRYHKGDLGPARRRLMTPEEQSLFYNSPAAPPAEGETRSSESPAPENNVVLRTPNPAVQRAMGNSFSAVSEKA
jgi:hypothetical protein